MLYSRISVFQPWPSRNLLNFYPSDGPLDCFPLFISPLPTVVNIPWQKSLLTSKNNILGYISRRELARSKVCTYIFGSYYQTTFQNGCSHSVFYLEVGVKELLFPQILARTEYYQYMLNGASLKGKKKRSCPITSNILYILDNL